MNKLLKEFLSYILVEETPAEKAKKMGLTSAGFGRWKNDQGVVTHKTDGDNLAPVTGKTKGSDSKKPSIGSHGVDRAGKKRVAKKTTKKKSSPLPKERVIIQDSEKEIDKNKLEVLGKKVQEDDRYSKEDKQRFNIFSKLWGDLLTADSSRQSQIVRQLADQNLITGGEAGKTIFLGENLKLPDNSMLIKGKPTNVTILINQIIRDEGIRIERLESEFGKALNEARGTFNEAGIVYHMNPNDDKLKAQYEEASNKLIKLGAGYDGIDEIDSLNKIAAENLRSQLPQDATVTGAVRIGNLSSEALKREYGIDKKQDPTDLIIFYTDNGQERSLKISAKIYNDVSDITMKNASATSAGEYYLKDSSLNDALGKIITDNAWDVNTDSEQTIKDKKVTLKTQYMTAFHKKMLDLEKTEEGQATLLQMWKSVHGCGMGVHTLIVDKKNKTSTLHDSEYYCNPKIPFKMKYSSTSITIDMNESGIQSLKLELKTETDKKTGLSKAPTLLFRHKTKSKKV
jgi:hypothetical protein